MEQRSLESLTKALIDSHWPKCNQIAEEILLLNQEDAKKALIEAFNAKRHHVRTAALKAIVKLNDLSTIDNIKTLLDDPAYETRIEAKKALKILTGEDFLTGKGE